MGLFGKRKDTENVTTHPAGLDEFGQRVLKSGGKETTVTEYDPRRASLLFDQKACQEAARVRCRAKDIRREALVNTFGPEGAEYINKLNSILDEELVRLVDGGN